MYGGSTAPNGWLLCNGAAVKRGQYAQLFRAIGTTYGTGDGSTTFNVPDLRQRFPLGKAASGTGSTLGGTGGVVDHTHGPTSTAGDGGTRSDISGGGALTVATGSHNHSINNEAAKNPPFQVVNFIIKV